MNKKNPSLSSPSHVADNYRTKFEGVRWKSSSSSVANCRSTSTASYRHFLWFLILQSPLTQKEFGPPRYLTSYLISQRKNTQKVMFKKPKNLPTDSTSKIDKININPQTKVTNIAQVMKQLDNYVQENFTTLSNCITTFKLPSIDPPSYPTLSNQQQSNPTPSTTSKTKTKKPITKTKKSKGKEEDSSDEESEESEEEDEEDEEEDEGDEEVAPLLM
jgi:hypothetical protein